MRRCSPDGAPGITLTITQTRTRNPGRHFFGPDWAINREFDSNYGILVHYDFAKDWMFKAGAFRSLGRKPHNIYLELDGLNALGVGDLNATSDPPSVWASTSGEARLVEIGEWRQKQVLLEQAVNQAQIKMKLIRSLKSQIMEKT